MTVGDRIKKIRELFEISSNEFAEITGIHPVTIRKYETNKINPSKEHIDKMCSTLKLPRIIFEGIPEQYTDYKFRGDFYQQLFLLYANRTLEYIENGRFKLNQELSEHLQVCIDGNEIPIDKITFSIKNGGIFRHDDLYYFNFYLELLEQRDKIKGKTPEKEDHRKHLADFAEEIQLKLMLLDHSWEQYMKGIGDSATANEEMDKVLAAGGTFYDYVDSLDAPESFKSHFIEIYEDARIAEYINMATLPENIKHEDLHDWVERKLILIDQYKEDHPNYKEEIRQEEESKKKTRKERK